MKKLILITLLATLGIFLYSCSKNSEVIHPEYKELTEAVYASGNIIPQNEYKVFAMADGYLSGKLVDAGDTVKTGTPLFVLDSETPDIKVRSALDAYQLAQQNYGSNSPVLAEMRNAMNSAKVRMQNDSVNFTRFQNLLKNKAASQADFDRAKLAYETSKNDYLSAKQRFESNKNQLYLNLKNAENQYKLMLEDKSNFVIKSKINGVVYEVYKEQGELIRRGETVALLGDKNDVYLRLTVDELDIDRVKIGQEILVKIDVYSDKVFKAKVSKIYPMLNKADQSFRVDAKFEGEAPTRFAGLTVEANIIIKQKDKALTIPRNYVVNGDSVWIKEGGEEKKIKITKGAENMEFVEVTSGLTDKSELILK